MRAMATPEPLDWPTWLTRAMDAAGIKSDAELARRAGIPQTNITRWRQGVQPRPDTLRRLARPLGVEWIDLMVASGNASAREAHLRGTPRPPERPVGAGVDPELLADVATLSDAEIQRVKDFIRGIKG